jgi:NAD-dependent SIR2 family protein deacetylase
MDTLVESLTQELLAHRPWTALTGAGVSAASGIPTYRDHDGRWLGSEPIQHQEFLTDEAKRRRYWARSALGWPRVALATPNKTHNALTQLQRADLLSGVITQNVDRLHQRAGTDNVIDLHGRLDQVRCLECNTLFARSDIQDWLEQNNPLPDVNAVVVRPDGDADLPATYIESFAVPDCIACKGTLMPTVVFFGGSVPSVTTQACFDLIDATSGLIVIGTSLSVFSGLRFCRYATQHKKRVIILNQGPTRADALCDQKYESESFSLLEICATQLADSAVEPTYA